MVEVVEMKLVFVMKYRSLPFGKKAHPNPPKGRASHSHMTRRSKHV